MRQGAVEYHNRAQGLAYWFIETADKIDLSDERWEVFYLYHVEKVESGPAVGDKAPAKEACGDDNGYFTVHNFRNPLLGVRQRVCQALLLPPYQRRGHGGRLLRHIYARAAKRPEVFEVTVEDPAPAFQLRDVTEAQLCRDANVFSSEALGGRSLTAEDPFSFLFEGSKHRNGVSDTGLKLCSAVLCPEGQPSYSTCASSHFLVLLWRYESFLVLAPAALIQEACKRFRLTVKRRLLKRHREELPPADAARKARLDELYREEE
ncbi:unnamed protein product, partial [Phaeothamnion confervicola]